MSMRTADEEHHDESPDYRITTTTSSSRPNNVGEAVGLSAHDGNDTNRNTLQPRMSDQPSLQREHSSVGLWSGLSPAPAAPSGNARGMMSQPIAQRSTHIGDWGGQQANVGEPATSQGHRAPLSPADVSAASASHHPQRLAMEASVTAVGASRGAPVSPTLVSARDSRGAPLSPADISAASASHQPRRLATGVSTDLGFHAMAESGIGQAVGAGFVASFGQLQHLTPPVSPTRAMRNRASAASLSPLTVSSRTIEGSSEVGGGWGVREARAASEELGQSLQTQKRPRISPPGTSASTSTGGRRKGGLQGKGSTCHGCRRLLSRTRGVTNDCVGSEEGGCHYWLCSNCFAKYNRAMESDTGAAAEEFFCCLHYGKEYCPCVSRRGAAPGRGPLPTLMRAAIAQNRKVPTSVFVFPRKPAKSLPTAPTTAPSSAPRPAPTPGRDVVSSTTYSVCTLNQLRVSVIKVNDTFMCSQQDCRRVEHLFNAATSRGDQDSQLPGRCCHAEAVSEASEPIQEATALLDGDGEFESALERVPPGTFNAYTLRAMRERYGRAKEEGVPVLVRLGETCWFAVRDGVKFQNKVVGEWGHVKSDTSRGSGRRLQCKSNNGSPCSDSSCRKKTRRCVHAAIVALYLYIAGGVERGEEPERDGAMDGVEFEPGGDMGGESDSDDDTGCAFHTQRENPALFRERMAMLSKIMAVYHFPVAEPQLEQGTYRRKKIFVNELLCTGCRNIYTVLPDASATLLGQGAQGAELRVIARERKVCTRCNLRGWAGDNYSKDGVLNYNDNLVIQLPVLYQLRRAFHSGTPVSTWVRTFLQPRLLDLDWLNQNPGLASLITDNSFISSVKEAYFAFEALGEHPYDFRSYRYGHFPEILASDGCGKIPTDSVSTAQFEVARQERYVDTDHQHQLLKISMISKMVFEKALRFGQEAAPTIGPSNRLSNIMLRTKRGKVADPGSPQTGDLGALLDALGDEGIDDLSSKTFADLRNIYNLCFSGGKGISRYGTRDAFVKCFQEMWESGNSGGEAERCAKLCMGRKSGTTARRVEGLFTPDGVMCASVFLVTAESAADAVDFVAQLEVQPAILITDLPCVFQPIADKLHPGLLENGGQLPRDAEGVVSLPALQHLDAHVHGLGGEHLVQLPPPRAFPSAPSSSGSGCDNAYAAFADAEFSPPVQPHLNVRCLLQHSWRSAIGNGNTSSLPERFCKLAEDQFHCLGQQGFYAMTLFEVVAVYTAWFRAAVKVKRVDDQGGVPGMVPAAAGGGVAEDGTPQGRAMDTLSLEELCSISDFLAKVVGVAIGSTTSGFEMSAPEFVSSALFEEDDGDATSTLRALDQVIGEYHMRKVSYITTRLRADDESLRQRAYDLVQAGVGFGVQEHSVKALQIALSMDSLGGGLDEDGKLPGYGISFNFKRNHSFEFGHFYNKKRVGMWLCSDGPHEGNHGACQAKYGGATRCKQLTGVSCNPYEQKHSSKTNYLLPRVSGMGFDTFTFNTTLISEFENASINRRTCDLAVTSARNHPKNLLQSCCWQVWNCGRCFCRSPLMRSFSELGQLRVTSM